MANEISKVSLNGTVYDIRDDSALPSTGTAASATKLASSRTIDGVSFDGSANISHYGTCSTAAGTTAKVVSLTGFTLGTGARVAVKFTYTNTATAPTLNVNSTGAKAIKKYGTTAPDTNTWEAGSIVEFIYDGTNWILVKGAKGAAGTNGTNGTNGANGSNATINGVNTLTLQVGDGLSLTQSGSTATISLNSDAKAAVEALKKSLGGSLPSTTLASNTPAVIQKVAAAGLGANFWSVGDKIGIAMNGTVGALTINGTYYAFIIGFNHNSGVEGLGIHFQLGKDSSGKTLAFCDSKYSTTGSDVAFRMNTTNTNTGGWASSYMRNTICPAFLAALPAAWQKVIAPCTKYTDNTGGGSDVAANVTSTVDKIWLLAEFEYFGARSYANSAEQNSQAQYDYYKSGNSKVHYKHNDTNTAADTWERSPRCSGSANFCHVYANGTASYCGAYYSIGVSPAFKVA